MGRELAKDELEDRVTHVSGFDANASPEQFEEYFFVAGTITANTLI